jgi:hypothetical protein
LSKISTLPPGTSTRAVSSQAGEGIRQHGEDQVQDDVVETPVSKRQPLRITLNAGEIELRGARHGPTQHGMGQVDAGVAVLPWQEWQIEASANTAQEHTRRRRRQGSQAFRALCPGGGGQRRVVERGDQGVTVT